MSRPLFRYSNKFFEVFEPVNKLKLKGKVWWKEVNKESKNSVKLSNLGIPIESLNPAILLVHQWTKMGGSAQLMEGMAKILATNYDFQVVTFDLRGSGSSGGSCTWTGVDEVKDVLAVSKWMESNIPCVSKKGIVIVGSSAGAPIAGSAVDELDSIIGYIGIGYTFGLLSSIIFSSHYNKILNSKKPKLFIQGSNDGFTSVSTLESKRKKCKGEYNKKLVVKNEGHFSLESPEYDEFMAKNIHQFVQDITKTEKE